MLALIQNGDYIAHVREGQGFTTPDGRRYSTKAVAGLKLQEGDVLVQPAPADPIPDGKRRVPGSQPIASRQDDGTWKWEQQVEDKPPVFTKSSHALANFVAWLEEFAVTVTGTVPADEKVAWPVKLSAAVAFRAGTADAFQTAMIEGEAAITGETPADLADTIIAKASRYTQVVTLMVGYRRKAEVDLAAVTDPAEYETVLDTLKAAVMEAASPHLP